MIVSQNALLNQYVPTFFIKDLRDGQSVIYDSVRKAFINSDINGVNGVTRLGQLENVSSSVDNPLALQDGQALVYNTFTNLWENTFTDYNTLLNKPTANSLLPPQAGENGKFLTTDGTNLSWANISSSGTVTSVAASGNNGITVSGSPITTSGTFVFGLGNITPTSVSATGAISGSNLSGTNTGDQVITLTGDVTGSGTHTFNTILSATGVIAGTYGSVSEVPILSVDAKGRITSVSNVSFSVGTGTVTSVGLTSANSAITVSGSPITTSGTLSITANNFTSTNAGIVAASGGGTANFLRADGTWVTPPTSSGTVTSVNVSGGTTGLTTSGGPIIGVGVITLAGTLSITNGGTGQTTATGAINALVPTQTGNTGKFLTTNGTIVSWASIAGTGTVTSVAATGSNGITVSGSPITSSGTLAFGLGAITPSSVVATGTVTGSNLSGTNTGDQTITLAGDVTGLGTAGIATTLATVNSNPGTFGSSTLVPVITVDGKGRITTITTASIGSGSGTVTSVAATGSADITVGGSPITTSGTLTFALSNTGVTANTYGSSTQVPVFTVDAKGRISNVTNTAISGAGSTTPEIVVFHYGSGSAGNFTPPDTIFSQTSGVTATVTDGANCIATYSFTGKSNPPKSITFYGQSFSTNTFSMSGLPGPGAALANIKISGGGTPASPDLANGIFTSSNIITLQTRMSDTGSSSTIGNRAWLVVVFGF